jgi:hypothetical protein
MRQRWRQKGLLQEQQERFDEALLNWVQAAAGMRQQLPLLKARAALISAAASARRCMNSISF